jgi:hypothetical protein
MKLFVVFFYQSMRDQLHVPVVMIFIFIFGKVLHFLTFGGRSGRMAQFLGV